MHILQIFIGNSYPTDGCFVCGMASFQNATGGILFFCCFFCFFLNNDSMDMYEQLMKVTGMPLKCEFLAEMFIEVL